MNESEVQSAVRILRRGTVAVKVIPFVLAAVYTLCLVAYMFTSDEVQTCLDVVFYVSPMTMLSNFVLSRIFKMCVWHRIECFLPIVPQVFVLIDTFVPLSEMAATINVGTVFFLFFASLINAYFTFLRK